MAVQRPTSPAVVDAIADQAHADGSSVKDGTVDVKEAAQSVAPAEGAGWFHWHEPGTSKEEKRLIFKLDWFLLSFSCLTYFIKQVSML